MHFEDLPWKVRISVTLLLLAFSGSLFLEPSDFRRFKSNFFIDASVRENSTYPFFATSEITVQRLGKSDCYIEEGDYVAVDGSKVIDNMVVGYYMNDKLKDLKIQLDNLYKERIEHKKAVEAMSLHDTKLYFLTNIKEVHDNIIAKVERECSRACEYNQEVLIDKYLVGYQSKKSNRIKHIAEGKKLLKVISERTIKLTSGKTCKIGRSGYFVQENIVKNTNMMKLSYYTLKRDGFTFDLDDNECSSGDQFYINGKFLDKVAATSQSSI